MYKIFISIVLTVLFSSNNLMFANSLVKGSTALNSALSSNDDNKLLPVIIVLEDRYDTQLLYSEVQKLSKTERRAETVNRLKQHSYRTQKELRALLETYEKQGKVRRLRFHWLSNVISVEADIEVLTLLDSFAGIERIEYDPLQNVLFDDFEVTGREQSSNTSERTDAVTYVMENMDVLDVWEQGFYGNGVVVAVLDTGINYNHYDLRDRMWEHEDFPYHGYDFYNDDNDPFDDHSHGTHCAGIIVGDGTSGLRTGVAPKARVMALKVLNSSGNGQQSMVWEAMEFAIEYGSDLLSMSMGWPHTTSPDRKTWREVMENLLSAGLIASVGAGNEGGHQNDYPIPQNLRTPGDCPPPWLNPSLPEVGGVSAVLSSGAIDSNSALAWFSSRGPVTWGTVDPYNDYPYQPGAGLIKPDIVSPGVEVYSLTHNNNTGYFEQSGTSMSTPATAGVIALMLEKNPELSPEEIAMILEQTAISYTEQKNNNTGSGRINALSATSVLEQNEAPRQPYNAYPDDRAIRIELYPVLRWRNNFGATSFHVYLGTDNPPTNILNGVQTSNLFHNIDESLESETTYYWRINAENEFGFVEGNVWSFSTVLPVSEDFEGGEFVNEDWVFTATGSNSEEWYVTSDESAQGSYSARSGQIGHNSTTSMSIRLDVLEDGFITFYRKVSSEQNYDKLTFYIGNQIIAEWSGEKDWELMEYPVTAGFRNFRWVYSKDPMTSVGQDAAWVDEITFPRHPAPPVKYAPHSLEYNLGYEAIEFSWNIDLNVDVNPVMFQLIGFNAYHRVSEEEEFEKINSEPFESTSFYYLPETAGDYSFYFRAVYRVMGQIEESDRSDEMQITIYPAPDEPTIEPPSGQYAELIQVIIEADEQVEVFYTLDGDEPDFNSELYHEPIELSESTILKARAYKLGHLPGAVVSREYELNLVSAEKPVEASTMSMRVYPNPLNVARNERSAEGLTIEYYLPETSRSLDVVFYNIRGQKVSGISNLNSQQGSHKVSWDLKDLRGVRVGSGVYLVKINSDSETLIQRIMVIR